MNDLLMGVFLWSDPISIENTPHNNFSVRSNLPIECSRVFFFFTSCVIASKGDDEGEATEIFLLIPLQDTRKDFKVYYIDYE